MFHAIENFIGAHWIIFLMIGFALIMGALEPTPVPERRRNIQRVIVRARGVRIYHNRPGEN